MIAKPKPAESGALSMLSMPKNVASLVSAERVMPLGPGTPNAAMYPALQSLTVESALAPHPVQDQEAAQAVFAGLWLYHNYLEESHNISQDLNTTEGSFWHGIMHRREPDAGTASIGSEKSAGTR